MYIIYVWTRLCLYSLCAPDRSLTLCTQWVRPNVSRGLGLSAGHPCESCCSTASDLRTIRKRAKPQALQRKKRAPGNLGASRPPPGSGRAHQRYPAFARSSAGQESDARVKVYALMSGLSPDHIYYLVISYIVYNQQACNLYYVTARPLPGVQMSSAG